MEDENTSGTLSTVLVGGMGMIHVMERPRLVPAHVYHLIHGAFNVLPPNLPPLL